MFKLLQVNDVVRIPPDKFDSPLEAVATEVLRATYEGTVSRELGIIIAVLNVKVSDIGKILPGNGGIYHKVSFDLLVFMPVIQEVIEGEVVDVTDFGVFVRIGPIDGLIHISQIIDDFITYDEKRGALMGKETHRILEKGMIVRARIITVSLSTGPSRSSKIGLTMRQPFLGAISWIEEDINKSIKEVKKEVKKEGK